MAAKRLKFKSGFNIVRDQVTTVTASDTIVTGLTKLEAVIVQLNDAPAIGVTSVTADLGDQAGTPAAGSFLLKSWKPTATNDATPVAASTFSKKVSYIAVGT